MTHLTTRRVLSLIDYKLKNGDTTLDTKMVFEIHGIQYGVASVTVDSIEKPNIKIELQ